MSDFRYTSYTHRLEGDRLLLEFQFSCGEHQFTPKQAILGVTQSMLDGIGKNRLDTWVFHLGLTEIASYWKAFCTPSIQVECGYLDTTQTAFWQKLLYKGLGEFFYVNKKTPFSPEIISVAQESGESRINTPVTETRTERAVLVPVGGGKDSIVTLELLAKAGYQISTTSAHIGASGDVIAKFAQRHTLAQDIVFMRTIDPHLLELNAQGFPNGHTPFSSILAFLTSFTAELFGIPYIALSNEGSADEPTAIWNGIDVNHQYSKSFEFELDFRNYVSTYIPKAPEYFSFLRPLYELQIVKLFPHYPEYFQIFKSCNVGQKTNTWCGKCPKCAFVALLLSAFVDDATIHSIFGYPILDNSELSTHIDALVGISEFKPFECVGTRLESQAALYIALQQRPHAPALLERYRTFVQERSVMLEKTSAEILQSFRTEHALPTVFIDVIQQAL